MRNLNCSKEVKAIMLNFKPKRLYQEIGLSIYQSLLSEQYHVGDRLPPEREIAEHYQVNRALIREALIMLELKELIEIRKSSGIYVINLPSDMNIESKTTHTDDDIGPFEYLQARQLFESGLTELAATQVTKNDIKRMNQALDREKQARSGVDKNYDGDKDFHMAIAHATQNSLLVDMLQDIWNRRQHSPMWKKLHTHIPNENYREEWLVDHAKILSALQQKTPREAKQAMWQHLENVKQRLFELSDINDPEFDGYLFSSVPLVSES